MAKKIGRWFVNKDGTEVRRALRIAELQAEIKALKEWKRKL